ncbi:YkgJ family cysteine cluster protein [Brevundimonas sp. FT23042]|uniref:YkgJ family cysteine cluster protein n=1 Tax=Brevundimonas sp. FT23042 TaxID=3393749 RepID=UPI003B58B116
MTAADGRSRILEEVIAVGDMTRRMAQRYEDLFSLFGSEALAAAERAPDIESAAWDVLTLLEAATSGYTQHFPNQPATDCRPGCAACCHLYVSVAPGLAALAADYIYEHFALREIETLTAELRRTDAAHKAATDPVALRLRCPLLGADNACKIYPVRPISCRAFTSKDAARCDAFVFSRSGSGIDQNPALFRFHSLATAALQLAARDRDLDNDATGLVEALIWELDHRKSSKGLAEDAAAGEAEIDG